MTRLVRWLLRELRDAPQRRPFRLPYYELVNEWQRTLSYTTAVILAFTLDLPATRLPVVLVLSILGLSSGLYGLRVRGNRPQALGAYIDFMLTPVIVGIATLSPGLTAVTGFAVAVLVLVTFQVDWRVVATGVGIGSAITLVGFSTFGTASQSNVLLGIVVFIISLTTIVLATMLLQWWQARRSLARRELELQSLLGVTPVMLASIDASGTISSIAGHIPDPRWTPGSDIREVMPPEMAERVKAAIHGESSRVDEAVRNQRLAITYAPAPEGATLSGFDISEREETREALEHLVRTKDRFVASISHELRTPLTAVVGFSQELRQSTELSDNDRAYVDFIAEQSAEMGAIIEDLLVAVRADLGLVTLLPRAIEVGAEIELVAKGLQPELRGALPADGDPVPATADPVRFRQIIRNLLTNAARYGGKRISVSTGTKGGRAFVEVRDDGPPIPEDRRDQIFQPFESAGRAATVPSAIGLGLSVSRTLADMMDGSLVYEHDGEWSTFRLELPASPAVDRAVA